MHRKSSLTFLPVLIWWFCAGISSPTGLPTRPTEYAAPSDLLTFAVSPNGKWITAFAADGTLLLWDTHTWQRRELISNYKVALGADGLAFGPDSSSLVVGDENGLVQTFKTPEAIVIAKMQDRVGVEQFEFSDDGTRLATWNHLGITVWDFRRGEEIKFFPEKSGFTALALNHNGTLLFTGTEDSNMEIWDVERGKCIKAIPLEARDWVNFIALDEKRRLLLSGQGHNDINVWDLSTDKKTRALQGHTDQVDWLKMLLKKHVVISVADDGNMKTWDYLTGDLLSNWQVPSGFVTNGGAWLVSVDPKARNTIQVWQIASRRLLKTLAYVSPHEKK